MCASAKGCSISTTRVMAFPFNGWESWSRRGDKGEIPPCAATGSGYSMARFARFPPAFGRSRGVTGAAVNFLPKSRKTMESLASPTSSALKRQVTLARAVAKNLA